MAVETLQLSDDRVTKKLLEILMEKRVTGFCTEVFEACGILDVSLQCLMKQKNIREYLKKKVANLQAKELYKRMAMSSKMDGALLNGFSYSTKTKSYLTELNFHEARAIFMARYRMWPTKANFPGRWAGISCNVCGLDDTDDHVWGCPGYSDIVVEGMTMDMFWDETLLDDIEKLKWVSHCVMRMVDRMENIQRI